MISRRRSAAALGASTIVMILAVAAARPQATPQASGQKEAWNQLQSMVGTWTSRADDGTTRTVQTYRRILQDKFLHVETVATSEADHHEDWEILSYDGGRDKVVLRQFVSEGYVNRYVLDTIEPDGPTYVFLSEASENAPPGFALRQTLRLEGPHQITSKLELAAAGQPFVQCAGGTLARNRLLGEWVGTDARGNRMTFRFLEDGGAHWAVPDAHWQITYVFDDTTQPAHLDMHGIDSGPLAGRSLFAIVRFETPDRFRLDLEPGPPDADGDAVRPDDFDPEQTVVFERQ